MAKFLVGNKVENAGSYRIKFYNSETKEFIHEVEYTGESDKSIKYDLTKLVEDTTDKFQKNVNYFLTISAVPAEDDTKYIESPASGEISFIIKDVPKDPGEGGETENEKVTFAINASPKEALIHLKAGNSTVSDKTGNNSITVDKGTTVYYEVSCEGYQTQQGTKIVSANTEENIELLEESLENELPEGFQELTLDGQEFIKQEGYLVDKDGVVQQNTNFNTYIINCDSSLIYNESYEGQYFIQTDIKAENKGGYLVCFDNNDELICKLNLETGDFKEGENYLGQLFQEPDNPERISITTFSGTSSDYINTIKFCKAIALPGEPLVGFCFALIPA